MEVEPGDVELDLGSGLDHRPARRLTAQQPQAEMPPPSSEGWWPAAPPPAGENMQPHPAGASMQPHPAGASMQSHPEADGKPAFGVPSAFGPTEFAALQF